MITLPTVTEKFCHFGAFELQVVSVKFFAICKMFSLRSSDLFENAVKVAKLKLSAFKTGRL
jgi:hypothetical protein